ncbi:MAG: DUF4115 domain-containing protein [Elusimicrobia bacterium]|nr:DUF4115 domain-containing protein [Elusimicrobiota bacterium]
MKALEDERWDELPARVFLEGFLVKYAEFLGLDSKEVLGELLERLGKVDQPAFNNPQPIPETVENDSLVPLRLGLFLAAVLILAAGGFFFLRRQNLPGPSPELPLNQVSEPEPVLPSTSTAVIPAAGDVHRASAKPHTVVLRAKDPVWLRVRLDGAVRYEGTLARGETRTWPFESLLRVRVGNLSRLSVSVNGVAMVEPVTLGPGDVAWPPRAGVAPTFVGYSPTEPGVPLSPISPVRLSTTSASSPQ